MAHELSIRCLILACGNSLRGDDGVGPWLASWAEEYFRDDSAIRVIARQQWTPELAEDIARAGSVLFVDSSAVSRPGAIQIVRVEATRGIPGICTHHLEAGQLLGLCREIYASVPRNALLLTIGVGSMELGGTLSEAVEAVIPQAQAMMQMAVSRLLEIA